ncbi:hypothetical protein P7C73_g4673, partial [Tremellales sp. Uapishka_1]
MSSSSRSTVQDARRRLLLAGSDCSVGLSAHPEDAERRATLIESLGGEPSRRLTAAEEQALEAFFEHVRSRSVTVDAAAHWMAENMIENATTLSTAPAEHLDALNGITQSMGATMGRELEKEEIDELTGWRRGVQRSAVDITAKKRKSAQISRGG